ncbi:hypothetical protein SSU05_0385 [Streptococcus suis 05ZYH33]|nr:hypothetical protein SSU05_0385 [Streptococcus suis 05ZYH33]
MVTKWRLNMIEGLKTVAEAVKPVVNEVGKRAIDAFEKPIDSDKRLEAASDNKTTFRYDGLSKPQEFLAQAQGFPKEIAKDIYNSQELKHYMDIGMRAVQFGQKENGEPRFCLIPKDLSFDRVVDSQGRTNAERCKVDTTDKGWSTFKISPYRSKKRWSLSLIDKKKTL